MKRIFAMILAAASVLLVLCACSQNTVTTPDYQSLTLLLEDLKKGEDVTGKTVLFKVKESSYESKYGMASEAEDGLFFVTEENSLLHAGQVVTVKIKSVAQHLESYYVSCEIVSVRTASETNN